MNDTKRLQSLIEDLRMNLISIRECVTLDCECFQNCGCGYMVSLKVDEVLELIRESMK